jgi:hypothetical protein
MTPTPTPVPDYNVPRLTVEMLENGTYYVPGMDEEVTLTDGQWINEVTKTYSEFVSISDIAFGDLNGDGVEDAAIALYEHVGISGHFQLLLVIINRNGVPVQSANRFVGGSVRRMAVRNGQIELEKIAYDGDDPNCCPSLPAVEKIQFLSEGHLVVRWASSTPEGNPHEIRILSPNNGSMVTCAVRVTGIISYAYGSKHLRYRIQNSAGEILSTGGFFITVDEKDEVMTFDALIDIQDIPNVGPVFLFIVHNDVKNNYEEVDSVDLIIG